MKDLNNQVYIEITGHPMQNTTIHLQSDPFPFISDAVRWLEYRDWYFDVMAKGWVSPNEGLHAKIQPERDRHKETTYTEPLTGRTIQYVNIQLA